MNWLKENLGFMTTFAGLIAAFITLKVTVSFLQIDIKRNSAAIDKCTQAQVDTSRALEKEIAENRSDIKVLNALRASVRRLKKQVENDE